MTAAEYRAALNRYEAALTELQEARAALVSAEADLRATVTGLDTLDRRTAAAR